MTIPENIDTFKRYIDSVGGRNLLIAVLLVVVGVGAFGLGRLSVTSQTQQGIRIVGERIPFLTAEAGASLATPGAGEVVASKNGSKYHYPWCAGASQISPKNLIHFASVAEARKAGYTPASNCKGLE